MAHVNCRQFSNAAESMDVPFFFLSVSLLGTMLQSGAWNAEEKNSFIELEKKNQNRDELSPNDKNSVKFSFQKSFLLNYYY